MDMLWFLFSGAVPLGWRRIRNGEVQVEKL
jgi:hypothetical protein